jgi:hypothetical protein
VGNGVGVESSDLTVDLCSGLCPVFPCFIFFEFLCVCYLCFILEAQTELKNLNATVMVVVAYGQILPKEVLQIPQYGCLNIHAIFI